LDGYVKSANGELTLLGKLNVTATLQDFCEAELIGDMCVEFPIEKGMTVLSM
jgi:hypothetical protein